MPSVNGSHESVTVAKGTELNFMPPPREAAALADLAEAHAFADFFDAAPQTLRSELGVRVERIAEATVLLAPGIASPILNRAIGLGMFEEAGSDDVKRVTNCLRQAGGPLWMLQFSEFSRILPRALEENGLVGRSRWAKMLRGREAVREPASDLRVEPATSAQLDEVSRVFADAFGMPPYMADWLRELHDRTGWKIYAVTEGSTVVGCGCLYLSGDAAWLGMGSVAASHQRRGGQGILLARRIADAIAAGAQYIFTETGEPAESESNPSLNNMKRAGFVQVASRLNYTLAAPS
ncbi:MAG TPA: hypothetical protein VM689_01450 [Aliidongia sp.]|nr:hypothetical protein [Aliidongia sp.]